MNVTRYIDLIMSLLLMLASAACSPVAPTTEQAAPTPVASDTDPFHPLSTRTGVEVIDNILEAIASGDQEALVALVEFTQAPCTHADGLGGPPKCREGEEEGTTFEVLPFLGGEGSFLRQEDIGNWPGVAASGIYAIYEVNAAVITSEQYSPIGKYVILFAGEGNQPTTALRIGETGIVRVDTVFDPSPENLSAMVEREAAHVILAPKN